MKKDINKKLDNFLGNEEDLDCEVTNDKKKVVKDRTIIERAEKIVITEDGRRLLGS